MKQVGKVIELYNKRKAVPQPSMSLAAPINPLRAREELLKVPSHKCNSLLKQVATVYLFKLNYLHGGFVIYFVICSFECVYTGLSNWVCGHTSVQVGTQRPPLDSFSGPSSSPF